jgi:DNA polymerase-3 subunit alpha
MSSVGITDHGSMSGVLEFYKKSIDEGVKPIVGIEANYVINMTEKQDRTLYHLVLLAKSEIGYRNLLKISSDGYTKGFYYKPRVDLERVQKYSEGLIAMTGCIGGFIPTMIIQGKVQEAEAELMRLKDIFDKDLYIELMDHGLTDQGLANPTLIEFGSRFDIPIVASNDCHYIRPDDFAAHNILLCIQTQKKLSDTDRFRFPSDQLYFKSQEEMSQIFPNEYLTRTLEIAEKCNLELDLKASHMPTFITHDGSTPDDYLWRRIQEGIQQRFNGNFNQTYLERINKEYDVIKRTGFASYFLIIDDMVQYAKRQSISVCPGRGSVGASMIAHLLGITNVDPVSHNLIFERFLTEDRVSPPDIDVDFNHDRRGEVLEYLKSKYGYAAQVRTFSRLSSRSLIREVGKALGLDPLKIDSAAKSVPLNSEETLVELQSKILEINNLDSKVIDIGTRLHGVIRHSGVHPGGIVISNLPISDVVPICVSEGIELTQFDKKWVQVAGLLKIDVLSNKFLTIIDAAMDYVKMTHGYCPEIIGTNDPETYELICSGCTKGVFQLGQACIRELLKNLKPKNFEEIVHLISLGRPGVLDSGMIAEYITSRAMGDAQYLHPSLEPILKDSWGVIIFQEQMMQIAVYLAGFNWSEADKLRKAVADQNQDLMDSMKGRFISGCVSNNIPENIAKELCCQINCGYGFNAGHAIGYAMLTYKTAYLKAHFPMEYYAALMSVKCDEEDERIAYISEARRSGIRILSPNVNLSSDKCAIVNNKIYLPLTAIKNVGSSACEAIVEERDKGEFRSYDDFCSRIKNGKVNKRVIESLAKAGAFDCVECRTDLLERLLGSSVFDIIIMEYETLGMCLSDHLFATFGLTRISEVSNFALGSEFNVIGIVTKAFEHRDKNGNMMAFVTIEDGTGQLELVIFSKEYNLPLLEGGMINVMAKLDKHEPLSAIVAHYNIVYSPELNLAE